MFICQINPTVWLRCVSSHHLRCSLRPVHIDSDIVSIDEFCLQVDYIFFFWKFIIVFHD